ncbi:response regulator transcription factor [Hydrogenophaga sp. BPS33]|nr:response regulator transcription factor [Hydrogenophaga sp. BPS33]
MSKGVLSRTILSIDDHELVRLGLRQVIVQRFGERFEVAEARSLEEALQFLSARANTVLLLLLDLHLGDTRGLAGLKLLRQRYPHLPIVVVSGTHDGRVREEALALGAQGYFCKTGDAGGLSGLVDTIERISTGTHAADQTPQGPMAQNTTARSQTVKPGVRLTNREIQLLELVLNGLDNQAIAAETGLALGSVKNGVSSIFLAFNVRSRAALMRLFA